MHGLVVADKDNNIIRNAIIWCDSRAIEIGERALQDMGRDKILKSHLNSPGNFYCCKACVDQKSMNLNFINVLQNHASR